MNNNIKNAVVSFGKTLAQEIYDDLKGEDCVGSDNEGIFHHEGQMYVVKITAWWEKSKWFSIFADCKEAGHTFTEAVNYF